MDEKTLEEFEASLCAPCIFCRGSKVGSSAFTSWWCTYCGGSGLHRTVYRDDKIGTYPLTELIEEAPWLREK